MVTSGNPAFMNIKEGILLSCLKCSKSFYLFVCLAFLDLADTLFIFIIIIITSHFTVHYAFSVFCGSEKKNPTLNQNQCNQRPLMTQKKKNQ